jgi:hypothetical protein
MGPSNRSNIYIDILLAWIILADLQNRIQILE